MSHSGRECSIFCSGIDPSIVLFLLASFILYVGFLHWFNWPVVYCMTIAVPFLVSAIFYFLGGFSLLFGVMCTIRPLIGIFPWIMCLCLVANVVYDILIYIDQKCVCETVYKFQNNSYSGALVCYEYFSLGFLGGLNYVSTLYALLLVLDYLKDDCCEN